MTLEKTQVPLRRSSIYNIWHRNLLIFGRYWTTNFFWILFEPLVILTALGYGLGAYIANIQGVSYLDFFFPGFLCLTSMTVAFLESTYGNFSKLNYQKIYSALVQTPVEPEDIVLGEALWAATKGCLSALGVSFVVGVLGHLEIMMVFPALLIIFLSSFIFGLFGMYVIAVVKNYDGIIYPTCGLIIPMSMLSGTYFPIEQLPTLLKILTYLFPLTHSVSMVRGLFLGGISWWQYLIHIVVLLIFAYLLLKLANKKISNKLIH